MRSFACHKFVNLIAKVDFPLLAIWTVATKADPLAASANVAGMCRRQELAPAMATRKVETAGNRTA